MFNKTYVDRSESKVVAVTKEIERSISPDKVVEMYDKTKDAAEKKILQSFVFDDNDLKGVVVEFEPDYMQRLKHYGIRFTLNGRELLHKITLKTDNAITRSGAYQMLAEQISEAVSIEIFREFTRSH